MFLPLYSSPLAYLPSFNTILWSPILVHAVHDLFSILFQHAVDAFVTPFVMSAGMHDDRPVGFSVKLDGAVIGPIAGDWPIGTVAFFSQGADVDPIIGGHGVTNDPAAFVVGRRQTGQKPGLARIGFLQIVLGNEGRVGHIDIRARLKTVLGHAGGDIGQPFVVQRLVRSVAVGGVSQNGDVAVDAQHRYQKLFEIRPFVLAVPIGDLKRRIDQMVIAEYTHGGGVKVQSS